MFATRKLSRLFLKRSWVSGKRYRPGPSGTVSHYIGKWAMRALGTFSQGFGPRCRIAGRVVDGPKTKRAWAPECGPVARNGPLIGAVNGPQW